MILRRNNEVLLTEFGIAIIAQSTRSAQARQPQEVAESVIYMAPEQLMGKPRPASDQYALAVVTYEWLSGNPPFTGSVQQIASQHLSSPPPSLHAEMPWISSTIESIIFKALAKAPQQRFASVQHFAMGLHTGEPTLTHEGYVGLDVHRAARIMGAGHGGQVLLSQTTANLVEQDLPDDVTLRNLGEHHLKDLARPKHLFQLVISGLPADFPPLKTLDTHPNNFPVHLTPFIGREQELQAILQLLRSEDLRV